jgi:hypothetical protein
MRPRLVRSASRFVLTAIALSAAVFPASAKAGFPEDDVAFELVGVVKNSPPGQPPTSIQYGYLSNLNGYDAAALFAAGAPAQNETTALFTFFDDSTTVRVIASGTQRVVNRDGTMTIYYDDTPDGDLTTPNPDTFRDGIPVLVMSFHHQVVLDTATGLAMVTFVNTVTSADTFTFNGDEVRLAKVGDKFRLSIFVLPDPAGLVTGKIAGTAVAMAKK